MNNPTHILIVDDEPVNIKILQRKLEKAEFEVSLAKNGRECLEKVAGKRPDIILLDIMMPEMDGIEACERLKSTPETASIPVIFISAKTDLPDKIKGLDTGGIDYITKPIDLDETMARIRTQLRLLAMHEQNLDLQNRLAEMRRTTAISGVAQGIAHNLNNLLGVVVGYLDLVKIRINEPEKLGKNIDSMERAIQRMVDIVRQLTSLTNVEGLPLVPVKLNEAVQRAILRFCENTGAAASSVKYSSELAASFRIRSSLEGLEDALVRVLTNAFESYPFDHDPADRPIEVSASLEGSNLVIDIADSGEGVRADIAEQIFDPFVSARNSVGRGLGLTITRHTLKNMQGDIHLMPRPEGPGTIARITLKLPQAEEAVA